MSSQVYKTGRTPAHLDRWLARNAEAPVWSAHIYTNSCSGAELRIPIEPLVRVTRHVRIARLSAWLWRQRVRSHKASCVLQGLQGVKGHRQVPGMLRGLAVGLRQV